MEKIPGSLSKNHFLQIALMLLITIVFFSCKRNAVVLEYTNAKEEVQPIGNFIFRFNKALVPDSLLNKWDSAAYISFEPKIEGRFRWEHPDELVFSPSRPLAPATSYKAVLNKPILFYSKYNKIEYADKLLFHTADLKLEDVSTIWLLQDENTRQVVPQVEMHYNYPVDPNELKDKLKIELDGNKMNFAVQTISESNVVSVRLLNVNVVDKDYDLTISVDKGMLPKNGNNATKEPIEFKSVVHSPFVLTINEVAAQHNGSSGTVTVKTNQPIADINIASYIEFDPSVKSSIEKVDNGFVVTSEGFDMDKSYSFTLKKGLRGTIGGVLKEDYTTPITFGELEPSVSFSNRKAVYLASQGNKNIEVKISNVEKVKVVISKIYESNLLFSQRYGYYPQESANEYYEDYGGDATLGDIVYEEEVDVSQLQKYGASRLYNFNIADRLPEFKGIYHIMIRSTKDYWVRDDRFISLSDIGLITKEGNEKVFVFANSIKTASPMQGVNMILYGSNNQVLGMGATDANGLAEIAYTRKDLAGFRPAMVIAKNAGDFNCLFFNSESRVNTSRFEVGGKRSNKTGLDAFIYAERDIYRPGERVNFSVVVRDQQWKSPGDIPLKLKFLLPNGKEWKSFRKNLNEQGSLEGNVDISAASITGTYSLEVYTSNDVLLSTKPFMIEEFVPDRIKVTSTLDKLSLQPGEQTTLKINAANFFGPPAALRNYEAEIQIKQKTFSSKKYNSFDFSLANQNTFFDKVVKEGRTDANGNAVEHYEVPAIYKNIGILQAAFYSTVFDETGRPVSRSNGIDIFTQPVFAGIGSDDYGYYALNQVVKFPLIVLNKEGGLVNGNHINVSVIKHEYKTVLSRSGSYFRYESQKDDKIITSTTVVVNGEHTVYSFIPRSPGDYELRVALPGANSYVARSFYSYGYWGGDNTSFDVNNEGNIDIEVDKSSYQVGDALKALFKTPFSGKMLVTVETDKVQFSQYINVDKRSASLDIKLRDNYLPNVYITATLIKPHTVSDIPLTVAHGFKNVKVEDKKRKLPVQIVAEKTVRSHTHQKVKVKATPGSYITLAAVDNGVLQVSDFKTPNPYDYFYASKALEVSSYDIYPLLFPELRTIASSTGGDGDLSTSKRVNPMPDKRVKIVSYWSGIAKANSSGEASFELDIPQFSGEVRLMAVAYKDQSFGSGESVIKVADPLVLSAALPRFLSPKDTVTVPLTITNTTNKTVTASAIVRLTGALQVVGNSSQTISLAPNSENRAVFKIAAPPIVGIGKVVVEVKALNEKFVNETDITIRPASGLQKRAAAGSIVGGKSQKINISTADFLPNTSDYFLVVSKFPALQLASQLNYLVQYPYGCTEQTISSAFPQLYYGDLADVVQSGRAGKTSAINNIQEAIRKIKMRQLYNGAITLWDDEGTEHWWSTIYAAHFLLEAQKAGYEVDKSLLDPILFYINNKLRNKQTITYYYNRNQQKKIAPKEVAYSLYILALANRANISAMNYYKANPDLLSLDSRYLLSATYALAGDKQKFRELLPSSFTGEVSVPETGGSFYSDIRDEAIALNVLIDVDPGNTQIPVMARHVADKLSQRSWYSTQESAFSFLALGKLAKTASRSSVSGDIKVNGKTIGAVGATTLKVNARQLGSTNVDILTKGDGRLYYWWQSEGISATGDYKEEDSYIKVRKKFFDRYGRAIAGNTFKQNDLIVVQITVEKSYARSIQNVVVTDLLPAGFEIENPRTKDIPGMDWIKNADAPIQLDVRDDRINLFVDLNSGQQTYYYAVRAVSPGVYRMGPVSADAMYNGEYHSYNGAGVVRVIE